MNMPNFQQKGSLSGGEDIQENQFLEVAQNRTVNDEYEETNSHYPRFGFSLSNSAGALIIVLEIFTLCFAIPFMAENDYGYNSVGIYLFISFIFGIIGALCALYTKFIIMVLITGLLHFIGGMLISPYIEFFDILIILLSLCIMFIAALSFFEYQIKKEGYEQLENPDVFNYYRDVKSRAIYHAGVYVGGIALFFLVIGFILPYWAHASYWDGDGCRGFAASYGEGAPEFFFFLGLIFAFAFIITASIGGYSSAMNRGYLRFAPLLSGVLAGIMCLLALISYVSSYYAHSYDSQIGKSWFIAFFGVVAIFAGAGLTAKKFKQNIPSKEELLHNITKTQAMEAVSKARGNLEKATIADVRASDAKAKLDKALWALQNEDFAAARTLAMNAIQSVETFINDIKIKIVVEFKGEVQPRIWNRIKMTVRNVGNSNVTDVRFEFSGMCQIQTLETIEELRRDEERVLNVAVYSEKTGSVPVNILVKSKIPYEHVEKTTQISSWIDIVERKTEISTTSPAKVPSSIPSAEGQIRKRAPGVEIMRETEFFQGYIRMKIAVQNNMESVITDATLKLVFNESSLRLDRVEPEGYTWRHTDILLGVINPREKSTIAIYFDPLICTSSNIDASLTYRRADGGLAVDVMDRKRVNVVCPIFFTEESANTAMLRNLVCNVLENQDSKVFTLPGSMPPQRAFEICKEMVQHRDIKKVRELGREHPFEAEAWYYGVTKGDKQQLIIKTRVIEESNAMELFVASAGKLALTGLLAELGHQLSEHFKEKSISSQPVQVTNITIKDSIVNRSSLLLSQEDACDFQS